MRQLLALVFLGIFATTPAFATAGAAHRCEIYEDAQGLTHARGADEVEAFACMGYLHARDRAWQMDYFRRIAQGRTAEILGFGNLRTDFFMRLLGLSERAETIANGLSPETLPRFQAYADGANAALARSEAYEFKKLRYRPEAWTVADSVALLLLESFEQTRESWEVQFTEQAWLERLGPDAPSLFGSDGLPWDTSILKEGESTLGGPLNQFQYQYQNQRLDSSADLSLLPPHLFGSDSGSNNWAVDSSRTASGHSLFANDPHLGLGHPPFWHHSHVQGGELDVIGAAMPGIPQIASGANSHVSWGLTNSNLTVARVSYVTEEELGAARSFRPVISFKLGPIQVPFFLKTFRRTANGWPILPLKTPKDKALLLRWSGFDLSAKDLEPLSEIMTAKDASELDGMLARTGLPSWNFVFADTAGTIGYRAIGRVPRLEGPLAFGIPTEKLSDLGTSDSFPSVLESSEMPHVFKPKRGFVATANNRQWAAGTTFDPGWSQVSGFRAFRIEELLAKGGSSHSVESFRALQCDTQIIDGRFLAQLLVGKLVLTGHVLDRREQAAIRLLQSWDYQSGLECQACGVYRRWSDRLLQSLSGNLNLLYRLASLPMGGAPELERALEPALDDALDDLAISRLSPVFAPWGQLHGAHFRHLAGDGFLPDQRLSTPGDANTVNVGYGDWVAPKKIGSSGHYEQGSGASQRLVVEMSTPPVVYSVLPGPNADLAERAVNHPDGPWMRWRDCQLMKREFPLDWSSVKSSTVEF